MRRPRPSRVRREVTRAIREGHLLRARSSLGEHVDGLTRRHLLLPGRVAALGLVGPQALLFLGVRWSRLSNSFSTSLARDAAGSRSASASMFSGLIAPLQG